MNNIAMYSYRMNIPDMNIFGSEKSNAIKIYHAM